MAELDELRKQAARGLAQATKAAVVGQDDATRTQRKRWLATAGVVGGGLGLLFLWGLLSRLGSFLIGLGFCAAVGGGAYYLLRGKYQAWQQKRLAAPEAPATASKKKAVDTHAELEAQLAELKRKLR